MINIKKLLLLGCLTILMEASIAQSRFSITVGQSGKCSGIENLNSAVSGAFAKGYANSVNEYMQSTTMSYDECNSYRNSVVIPTMNSFSTGECRTTYTITQCSGGKSGSGTINILGPDEGYSFYSPNGIEEIINWEKDAQKKLKALDYFYKGAERPKYLTCGEKFDETRIDIRKNTYWGSTPYIGEGKFWGIPNTPLKETNSKVRLGEWSSADYRPVDLKTDFSKVNNVQDYSSMANKENVERYLNASTGLAVAYLANPQDLTLLIHNQFKVVSGYDVDAIRQKLPSERTKEEQQALIDYQEFRKETLKQMYLDCAKIIDETKEKKEIDAAILAWDVYSQIGTGYIGQTNYKKLDLKKIAFDDNDPMNNLKDVAQILDVCNGSEGMTGMRTAFYYNEITDKYVLSCAGSDDKLDVINDVAIALGLEVPQYNMAISIANAINQLPEEIRSKIEIVGHSLGGGIASIIGLATGLETKTFNAAMVSDRYIKEIGAEEKVKNGDVNNITRYHTSTDLLTNLQESSPLDLTESFIKSVKDELSSAPQVSDSYMKDQRDYLSDLISDFENKDNILAIGPAIGNPVNIGNPTPENEPVFNMLETAEAIPVAGEVVKKAEGLAVSLGAAFIAGGDAFEVSQNDDGTIDYAKASWEYGKGMLVSLAARYVISKTGAKTIKGALGHKMEPMLKDFINKNPEINRRQHLKSRILNEMNKIDYTTQETILIKKDE